MQQTQPQNKFVPAILLAVVGLLLYRNLDLASYVPIAPLTPVNPPSAEVSALMQRLNGQISGPDARKLGAIFAAAARHAEADGSIHRPPFIQSTADAQERVENIGDLSCPEWRFGTKYPAATTTIAAYLQSKMPVDGDFNRVGFVDSLKTCGEALARL